ncbi:nesprin-1, partial [Elysia marginata]
MFHRKYGLQIKDFGKSWKDGVAFNAMIHNIRPDLVDMDQIRRQQARINLEHAFSTAETELGIPRLLDPEDVDVAKPDEKSIMTYVAQFLKAYPDAGGASGLPGLNMDTPDKEMKAYNTLMTWLNTDAQEVLATSQEPIQDRESEFMDYLGFKTELDRREPLYLKIGEKVLSGRALKITRPDWEKLDILWQETDEKVRQWLLKLDASLPGKLGKLGEWLYHAEKLMRKKEEVTDNYEEMATYFAELAKEHREFFKDLEEWKQFLAQIKRAGRYEGMMLQGRQFDHLCKRLESVTLHSTVRQNRLDYTHMRYKLLASLGMSEAKLAQWTVKYGHQDEVEDLLTDYVTVVEREKLLEGLDNTLTQTKSVAEKYKMGGSDKIEASQIDLFLEETGGRCKKLAVEVKSVRSMLDEVVAAWKRYNACVDLLTAWITDGEHVMTLSVEEKEEFFRDISQHEDQHKLLNESANFLIDVCSEPVAAEIQRTLMHLNQRFSDLVNGFQDFRQNEVIGKARTEYETGVASLETWLHDSSDILDQTVKCIHADLKAYLLELDKYNDQIQEVETNFKVTTKTAQSLVKDSSQEVVNEMLQTLNVQKEAIVKIRKEIPERIKYLKAVLPNVESLETGILDLERWLEEGTQLLQSHKLDGTAEETEARLERHKAFFTETTYQKSILESKNKVFQKISGTKSKLKNVDFSPADDLMNSANEKFQNVVSSAKDWEKQLETLARTWRTLQQRQQQLEDWLHTAQNILDDSDDDPDSLIRKHKAFFDRMDKRLMSDYESSANEILRQLEPEDSKLLAQTLDHLKERWEHVLYHAPMKLLKLQFAVPEDKFETSMEKAEVELKQQQDQIRRNHGVKEALLKHRQMFQEGNLVSQCEQWLKDMNSLAQQLLSLSGDEKSLEQRHANHLERWNKLKLIMSDTHLQLKQLPERWRDYHQRMDTFDGWLQKVEKLIKGMGDESLTSEEYKEMLANFQSLLNKLEAEKANIQAEIETGKRLQRDRNAPSFIAQSASELDRKWKDTQELAKAKHDKLKKQVKDWENYEGEKGTLLTYLKKAETELEKPSETVNQDNAQKDLQAKKELQATLNKLKGSLTEMTKLNALLAEGASRERQAPLKGEMTDIDKKLENVSYRLNAKLTDLEATIAKWNEYYKRLNNFCDWLNEKEAKLAEIYDNKQDSPEEQLQKAELLGGEGFNNNDDDGDDDNDDDDNDDDDNDDDDNDNDDNDDDDDDDDDDNDSDDNDDDDYDDDDNDDDDNDCSCLCFQGISSQVYENHVTLENLEKDAKGLTQNFRSRETAALKSKLTSVRRQWESLCARAKDRSTALSGNVAHWQRYQNLHEELMPWIIKAEKYCATELPKCSSLDEAKDLYELHQAFLQECEEHLPIFDQMSTEAGYLIDQPNMHRDLEDIQKRWGKILTSSEDRSQKALQEEVRSQQPQLNALTRQHEQLQAHASPEGQAVLKSKQDAVKGNWQDINEAVVERQRMLAAALQHRRDFYSRLGDTEKWIKKIQRKLDSGNEIYSDEVADTQAKLK